MIKTIATALTISLMATSVQATTLEYLCVGGDTPDGTYEVKFDSFTQTMSYWGGKSFIVNPVIDTRIENNILTIIFDRRSPNAYGILTDAMDNQYARITWRKGEEVAINNCYFVR